MPSALSCSWGGATIQPAVSSEFEVRVGGAVLEVETKDVLDAQRLESCRAMCGAPYGSYQRSVERRGPCKQSQARWMPSALRCMEEGRQMLGQKSGWCAGDYSSYHSAHPPIHPALTAPAAHLQHHAGQVGALNLRQRGGRQLLEGCLSVQPEGLQGCKVFSELLGRQG